MSTLFDAEINSADDLIKAISENNNFNKLFEIIE